MNYKSILRYRRYGYRLVRNLFYSKYNPSFFRSYFSPEYHTFFGYFDICPIDSSEKLILAGRVLLSKPENMEIGFYRIEDKESIFHQIGKTKTWCWQMGSRLQWHPCNDRHIIFNNLSNGSYGTLIKNIEGKTISQLNFPIYALENKGTKFLSLNFSRLERLRPGYGYNNLIDETKNVFEPKNDGIFQGDLRDDHFNLICSIKDIANINRIKSMDNSMHYVNHISYSPNNNLAIFFHLWVDNSNVKRSRAMLLDIKKNEIREFISPRYTPSHFCWINNDKLILTLANGPNGLGYYSMSIKDNIINQIEELKDNVLDGHPFYIEESNEIIADTTPDMFLDRQLFSFNLNTSKKMSLGKFYSPLKLVGKERCDLHPRASNRYICIDSSHQGQRGLYILKRSKEGGLY